MPWSSLRIPPPPQGLNFPLHEPSTFSFIHLTKGLLQVTPLGFLQKIIDRFQFILQTDFASSRPKSPCDNHKSDTQHYINQGRISSTSEASMDFLPPRFGLCIKNIEGQSNFLPNWSRNQACAKGMVEGFYDSVTTEITSRNHWNFYLKDSIIHRKVVEDHILHTEGHPLRN